MTINGHVESGKIILDEPVSLVDGIRVRVELLGSQSETDAEHERAVNSNQLPTLYDQLKPMFGIVNDLPTDFARNHDHYLHGQPKK